MLALRVLLSLSLSPAFALSARSVPGRAVTPRGDLLPEEKSTIELFKKASGCVVYITTLVMQQDLFSLNVLELPRGTGSGFLWDDKGHVVTNFHVLMGNVNAAQVTLADGSSWKARLIGGTPSKDLAVLKIDAPISKLKPIPVGTSADLQVGQQVYAIGNPFGLDQTLTKGVISALGREIGSLSGGPIQGVIQTDAAINPGNSGGPLLDSAGRLIGVNTQIYSPSGASAGVGFAVPVDIVNRVVPQLIAHGRISRPGFGMDILDDAIALRLGVEGVIIRKVPRGSAAWKAGLKPLRLNYDGDIVLGDVIVAFEGKPVRSTDDLFKLSEERTIGETVTVTVLNDGRRRDAKVVLQDVE